MCRSPSPTRRRSRYSACQDEPALLLGTDLLETFRRVSLDFRSRKVRFQLRKCGTTGILISTQPTSITRLSSGDKSEVCKR